MNSNGSNKSAQRDPTDDYISFTNDSSTSNCRKTPYKLYSKYQNPNEQFSPHGSPQGFSSPIYNQNNYNRRQSGNSYGERYRGNQSYTRGNQSYRGNNWKNRGDKKPYHNRSNHRNDSGAVDISDYFHPSMIQDPWKHFQLSSSQTKSLHDSNSGKDVTPTPDNDDPGSST